MPREHAGGGQCEGRDQNIAAGAVKESTDNLAWRAGPPEGVKRQLDRLPDEMADGRKGDIEPNPKQAGEWRNYKLMVRKRSALVTTSTELMLMAALAIIGLSSRPRAG
jgi:hypothetical protein